jgi:hypothetical protein
MRRKGQERLKITCRKQQATKRNGNGRSKTAVYLRDPIGGRQYFAAMKYRNEKVKRTLKGD